MSESIREWTKKMRLEFPYKAERVLDIGSLNVNGSVKEYFNDALEYIGIDFREGKDVDYVMNAHDITEKFIPSSFNTVVCMDMLEHDDQFWITIKNINDVLKVGGHLFVVMPTINFPIHNHPNDYWRATESAFKEVIFKGYELLNMETVYTKDKNGNNYDPKSKEKGINPVLCALGRKL